MVIKRCIMFVLILCILVACAQNAYLRFSPDESSYFKISFQYPSNWKIEERQESGYERLEIWRPSSYLLFSENFFILSVRVDQLGKYSAQEAIGFRLQAQRTISETRKDELSLLSETEYSVAGMTAHEFVFRHNPPFGFPGIARICRTIFMLDKDRCYMIESCVYEADLDSAFAKDVDHLLDSIEKVR